MMDPFAMIKTLSSTVMAVKGRLDQVETNKDICENLKRHIEMVMETANKIQVKSVDHSELEKFVEVMNGVLKKTEKLTEKFLRKKGTFSKIKKAWSANDWEEDLKGIHRDLDLLAQQAQFLTLAKMYEEKKRHVTSATKKASWEVPYEEVCLFCYVTKEEHVVIGGQRPGKDTWELRAYNSKQIKEEWHFECSGSVVQPSDITQIENQGSDFFAILVEETNSIMLFDRKSSSMNPEPVFGMTRSEYRIRRLAALTPHRLVISVDPSIAAGLSTKSQLRLLRCDKRPFRDIKQIHLDCLDTHSLTALSSDEVAVVCGRPNKIQVFDIDKETLIWRLEPSQITGAELSPEILCNASFGVCVYDSDGKRIVAASNEGWSTKHLLDDSYLGEFVCGMSYLKDSQQIAVLHEMDDNVRISLFKVD